MDPLKGILNLLELLFKFLGFGNIRVFYITERPLIIPGGIFDQTYTITQGKEGFLKDIVISQFSNLPNFDIKLFVDNENFPVTLSSDLIIRDDDILELSKYVNMNNKIRVLITNNDILNDLDIYFRLKGYILK